MPPIAVISIARDNVGYLFSFVSLIIYWPRIWSSKLLNETGGAMSSHGTLPI